MIFTSDVFVLFAFVFYPLYFAMPGARSQNALALGASYVFYGWWDARFLALILGSTLVNFALARRVRGKRALLLVAVAFNLGLLGFFKYFGFFTDQMVALMQALGVSAHRPSLTIILPVGISFFTFQALSYVIDVARGRMAPEPSLLRFATYIALFPQLVAGPIVRAGQLLPQLRQRQRFRWPNFWIGAEQVLMGAALKLILADRLAPMADRIFEQPALFDSFTLGLGVVFFAFQIYGDFAGYSLMAIGLARIMGLRFPLNFRRPYLATGFSAFWRRWHISLSSWLRDYLYIALGGNRVGPWRTRLNLMATMLLGGLWHGAGWPFLIWGAMHGSYLGLARAMGGPRRQHPLMRWGARAGVFCGVCLAWIFFRAPDLDTALAVVKGLVRLDGVSLAALPNKPQAAIGGVLIAVLMLAETLREDCAPARRALALRPVRLGRALLLIGALPVLGQFQGGAFVYFQF
ncbi:MAG: MBOAT family protein [Rhodobacteraceae bacterium]|nr:MBOAT family protein [Paracoccaceae bacterium]